MGASVTSKLDPNNEIELVLGRYRVLEKRGKGGFGTVSVCWDPRLTRRVAIKEIPLHRGAATPGQDDAQARLLMRAALREAQAAGMLAHPNIVGTYEFEPTEECAYIIMECVEGVSLGELLDATDDGLLTFDEAAAVLEAVGDALAYAHANGILHLDVKPDNILVDPTGRVRLTDFGMATLSTATGYGGAAGGTVGYMPPEQIQGAQVDVRTDVFALACVMYEALTGVQPFAAPTPADSLERICETLADPCALNEEIPPLLADALLSALDPDPLGRPESVRAFMDEALCCLGSARAGKASLADLVADIMDDEKPAEEEDATQAAAPAGPVFEGPFAEELGPVMRSVPALLPRCLQAVAALSSAAVAGLATCSWAGGLASAPAVVAALASGVVGAIAPQLGGALAAAALVAAAVMQQAWPLAVLALAAGVAWWMGAARLAAQSAGVPLVGAACLHTASPAPALASALFVTPGKAALSAAMAASAALTLSALAGSPQLGALDINALAACTPESCAAAFRALAAAPATWLAFAGWVLSAAVLAACAANGSKLRCYLGVLCSTALVAGFQVLSFGVENGGSWAGFTPEALVGVVVSFILLCLIICLFGTPRSFLVREDEAA